MAQEITTIIIAEISSKNGWYNIKTNDDKEVSVMEAKCPKLTEVLKTAKPGTEIIGKLVEKDSKWYMWDPSEGGKGGKSFTPADKSFQAALAAGPAASALLSLSKEATFEKWNEMFEKIHAAILAKKSA